MNTPVNPLTAGTAPSITLPFRFIITGILALVVGTLWLVVRPDVLATYHYNQYVVAITHVFTLGFISSIIMGAMYQLVPVALQTHLFSERLGRWHFVMHLVGWVGMVWMFWVWDMKQVGHFGSVLGAGILLFACNIGRTLARVPRWDLVAWSVAAATGWLTLTLFAGLFVATAKCWSFSPFSPIPQMHAHDHLGGIGFFVMMLVGVSYKLVPMFVLSEIQSQRRAALSVLLLNIGLVGVFVTVLLDLSWKPAFAVLTTLGLAVYGWELAAILQARKRRQLDWGLKYFLTAVSLLIPVCGLGIALAWPGLPATALTTQLENVYGFLALSGVLTLAILGMLYKIVPFLVWYARYSKWIGRTKVPSLADLYSTRLQIVSYWLYVAGLVATSIATALSHAQAVQAGCALLASSVLVFAWNMGLILRHLPAPKETAPALQPAMETN